jgi:hypothetical protein
MKYVMRELDGGELLPLLFPEQTDFYAVLDTGLLVLEIRLVGLAAERDGRTGAGIRIEGLR